MVRVPKMAHGIQCCPRFLKFRLPDQRLYFVKNMCIHTPYCVQTVYELPLLPNNSAVKHIYTDRSGAKCWLDIYRWAVGLAVTGRIRDAGQSVLQYSFHTIYDMIYLLTAIGLPPGGSNTVHIYTRTVHRTTQNKQYIEQHKNFGRVRAVLRLDELYSGICLTTEEKARKTLSQVSRTIRIHRPNNKNTYKQQLSIVYMSSNTVRHLITRIITTLQHFTSPHFTQLHFITLIDTLLPLRK
jgi:hypothetical protein